MCGVRSLVVRIIGTTIGALIALVGVVVLVEAMSPSHVSKPSVVGGLAIARVLLLTYASATFCVALRIRNARGSQR